MTKRPKENPLLDEFEKAAEKSILTGKVINCDETRVRFRKSKK
jgi:hypothetical protein